MRGGSSANPQFSEPIANHALQPKAAKQVPFRQHFPREAVKATTQSEECRRNAFKYPETCPPLSWENPRGFGIGVNQIASALKSRSPQYPPKQVAARFHVDASNRQI